MQSIEFYYEGKHWSCPEGRDWAECTTEPGLSLNLQEGGEDYVILENGETVDATWREEKNENI